MNANHSILDCTDPWLDTSSKCWPLDEHHYAEVHAVCYSIQTDSSVDQPTDTNRPRCRPPRKPGLLPGLVRRHALTQTM